MSSTRTLPITAIMVLLLPHLPGIFFCFPATPSPRRHRARQSLRSRSRCSRSLTLAGLWMRKPWALWATLVVVACKATIDLFSWSQNVTPALALASLVVLVVIAVLVFLRGGAAHPRVTVYQRAFTVPFSLCRLGRGLGLVLPRADRQPAPADGSADCTRVSSAQCISSGSTFMLLAMLAKDWHEVRVVTMILALWTGMLGRRLDRSISPRSTGRAGRSGSGSSPISVFRSLRCGSPGASAARRRIPTRRRDVGGSARLSLWPGRGRGSACGLSARRAARS